MTSALDQDVRQEPSGAARKPPHHRDVGRTLIRGTGQMLLTVGMVALLFVGYQLWVTDFLAGRQQQQLSEEIQEQWADTPTVAVPLAPSPGAPPAPVPPPAVIDVAVGEPFAVLHIPRLGEDYERVVVEGTAQVQLAQGPGHYVGTAMPGEQGNAAFAGHRVGRGSPFLDLDRLRPGDPIVVETADTWFVYRVLGRAGSDDFTGDASGVPGRRIVRPADIAVLAPTPGGPAEGPATGAFLTLTTCHPKYSAQQRLVIHAALDGGPVSKATAPDGPPALLG